MGGSFISIADDATSASWNPGGLIQLDFPEISFAVASYHRTEDNSFGANPEADGTQSLSEMNINYLSAAYPFTAWGRNMIVSLNYQNLYDFNREWSFPLKTEEQGMVRNEVYKYEQSGNLYALGLAYCVQITPRLSAGLTLNFWNDGLYKNEWEEKLSQKGSIEYGETREDFETQTANQYAFSGFNANFGILWNAVGGLTIGAVFKTPFKADLTRKYQQRINGTEKTSFESDETMEMHMSYGLGFAYRFSDAFSASIDIYRTEWDDFIHKDYEGNETSPVTGQPAETSDIDPTHQVRAGAEYIIIGSKYAVPIRGGIFYDPLPAQGSPDTVFGFSLGTGIALKWFVFDIAYQYRYGNNVGESMMQGWEFSQDIEEHTVYSSLIIHF
jgi:hypothetical protein